MDNSRLVLEASTASDAKQMAALVALGACLAVREGAVTPEFACDKLFRPVFIQRLRVLGLEEQMLDLLSEALELEDLARLAQAGVAPLIDRVINAMLEYLRSTEYERTNRFCWVRWAPVDAESPSGSA